MRRLVWRRGARVLVAALAIALGAGCGEDSENPPSPESPPVEQGDRKSRKEHDLSTREALRMLRERLPDVPIAFPSPLPSGATVDDLRFYKEDGQPYAQVQLSLGSTLQLQYGRAGFDGCPSKIEPTKVGGADALISTSRDQLVTTVIWPVLNPMRLDSSGVYGITAPLPPKEMLQLAESMEVGQSKATLSGAGGC